MVRGKRGLSEVVTTVLLILLVIAAIGIIWGFVQPFLTRGGEAVTTVCLTLDIQPVNCKINYNVGGTATTANITYKWAAGDAQLSGVKLLLERTDGNSKSIDGELLNRLETRTMNNVSFDGTPGRFSVAGIALGESGKPVTCPESKVIVDCK